jgi:predicted lipid-binding transport protein (Tim44 family)
MLKHTWAKAKPSATATNTSQPARHKADWGGGLIALAEGLLGWGLVSGAALSAALGKLLLAGVLAAVAAGVFLRLWRGRMRSQAAQR